MSANVRKQGDFELFETTKGHQILVLEGKEWYAWIKGQQSPIIVQSDSDHKKDRTIWSGQYYLVDFEDDPDFKDMPHLFLQDGDRFHVVVLPNGLPSDRDQQKRLVETDETIDRQKLERHLGKSSGHRAA